MTRNASAVIRALKADNDPKSGWMKAGRTGVIIEPREELFLQQPGDIGARTLWIRVPRRSRVSISGWSDHGLHFWKVFGLIGSMRIRRAVRDWADRKEQAK